MIVLTEKNSKAKLFSIYYFIFKYNTKNQMKIYLYKNKNKNNKLFI